MELAALNESLQDLLDGIQVCAEYALSHFEFEFSFELLILLDKVRLFFIFYY